MDWLASLLGGPGINGLIGAYKAKLEAANTEGAQAADLAVTAIAAEIEVRKSAQAIIIAEQGRWWTALPRAIVQWSFAVFVAVRRVGHGPRLGGTTEPLGGDIATWAGWVMALWFAGALSRRLQPPSGAAGDSVMDLAIIGLLISTVSATGAIFSSVSSGRGKVEERADQALARAGGAWSI